MGASAVVANLSDTHPVATAFLLTSFYTHWREDPGDPAYALTAAQRHTRDVTAAGLAAAGFADAGLPGGTTPFADPVNWSGFVCSEVA